MNAANIQMLEFAAAALAELPDEVVFVGGATIELWVTDEAAPEFRPTDDVDIVAEIATRSAYHRFEERLRGVDFVNEPHGGVLCRFRHRQSGVLVDAMPTEAELLGFENRWQKEAFPHAVEVELPSGRKIDAVPPVYLLATKLEAFGSRGKNDLYWSKDFEDTIVLVDGRAELVAEIEAAPPQLCAFVGSALVDLLSHHVFDSAGEGVLRGGPETQERFELLVKPRVESIAAAASDVRDGTPLT